LKPVCFYFKGKPVFYLFLLTRPGKKKMKKELKRIIMGMAAAIYIVAAGQYAVNRAASKASGGMPGSFMSWGAGARSLGMGKAFVALADDASATYWNPAGLSDLSRSQLTALHSILWGGTVYDFVSYVYPTKTGGTLGFSGTRLFLGGFEGRDSSNRVTHTFEDIQSAYGISYGQKVMETLSVGANLKKMSHTLDDHTSGSYIIDVSAMYNPINNLKVGANLQNLLAMTYGTSDELPIVARVGVNYKLLRERLSLGVDIQTTIGWEDSTPYYVGAEYWAMDYLALRMGIDPEEFNVGFGLKYEDYGVDYAYATHQLGGSHRLSATVNFGRSVKAIKERTAREYSSEGDAAYRVGMYDKASGSYEKAYSLNPEDKKLSRKLTIISRIAKIIPRKVEDTYDAKLLRRGINEYIENQNHKVLILALNNLIAKNPNDQEGIQDPRIKVAKGLTLSEFKLQQALQDFYDGEYARVIEQTQDVVIVEPDNAQAYKRMGSAFFAIGNEEKALEAWKKSLQLNPSDNSLRDYINRVSAGREPDITNINKEE
jgi:tetratricopeptide (TPR) repeat protein